MEQNGEPGKGGIRQLLSPAEEAFERKRKVAGFILAPLLFTAVLVLPIPGLPEAARKLAAILCAALASSLAFMLPVSTPPNAIIYAGGMIPITRMLKTGILLSLSGTVITWLVLRLMLPLLGLACE